MTTRLAVLLMALMAGHAQAQGLAFKDLVVDGSLAEARKIRPFDCSVPTSHPADMVCGLSPRVQETIAGVPVRLIMLFAYGDAIDTIAVSFAESNFRTVMAALVERYGPPTKNESSTVTNRMGASFEQLEHEWAMPEGRISARRYSSTLEVSSVNFYSPKSRERFAEQRRQRTQQRAKDL